MPRKPRYVEVPASIHGIASEDCGLRIEAAEGDKKLPTFTMTAYTGGKMNLLGWRFPVVVDIAGIVASRQNMPILKGHDDAQIVGHSTSIEFSQQRVRVAGVVSGVGPAAEEVKALAANGYPWQVSIGADATQVEFVDRGEQVKVNGKVFAGPVYVARRSALTETSFVSRGADSATSASVAAKASNHKEREMDEFNKWLEAHGFDADHMEEKQLKAMKETFDRLEGAKAKDDGDGKKTATATLDIEAEKKQLRAELTAESKRVAAIRKLCAGAVESVEADKLAEIEAKAIDEDWSEDKTELAIVRASRAKTPAIHVAESISAIKTNPKIVEAALCVQGNLLNVEKQYDDKTLQAAHDAYKGRINLHTLLLQAAHLNGYHGISVKADLRGVMEAAFRPMNAAFSTLSLPGILGNVANKFLLAGFNNSESVWREISSIRNVSDFKTVTSYRMIDDMIYEEVGKGGELKHGEVGEESYTNRAKTYGKMFAITRNDLINDDLGALTDVPMRLGSGAADKLNLVFWTEFLANTDFFKDDHAVSGVAGSPTNDNYDDGADSVLSIDSLTAAELLFRNLVKPNGLPLGVQPRFLLVPNALATTATLLMSSLEVRDTTASTKFATENPHAGKFQVKVSAFLSNTSLTGYSTTKWYLLADPRQIPVIETCFLNGQQSPTVESAEADFNVLGIQMRGYHDFGVSKQDYRGGVAMNGA